MPYKRYDIKNKYNYRGRRTNDPVMFKTVMLIVLPLVIVGIIALGVFIAYKTAVKKPEPVIAPVATVDEVDVVPEEELLRLVNDNNPLDENFVPSLSSYNEVLVSEYLLDSLTRMIDAAKKDGVEITVSEGYISFEEQGRLYEETFNKLKKDNKYSDIRAESEAKKVAPEAGSSEAQTGLLIKLSTKDKNFEGSEAQIWLEKYAVSYGFILRYPKESESTTDMTYNPQLYRYIGEEHALNVRRYGMTLDEYFTHISMQ